MHFRVSIDGPSFRGAVAWYGGFSSVEIPELAVSLDPRG